MEKLIGLKDLRLNMDKYVAEIKAGKSFVVLKQSKPIFKLTPVDIDNDRWEEVIDFTKIKRGGVDIDALLAAL
jgi:antitoxin (DNA-binding transcriptional repressor) of toxin-antitoxin stability system